jgi:TRAP-type mannitol/chloroaromatic compound transport system substrate-binding protein
MQRRKFLKTAGIGAAAATLAAPAIAQNAEVRWRLASSFPKSLDTLYGAAEYMAKLVSDMTGGKFQIRCFGPGEVVPPLAVVDAVQENTVEMAHTASYYFVGKDPTFAFDASVPFGLNSRQLTAWLVAGGGRVLMNEFFRDYNIYSIPCGNTGAQMGGWFRKEIKTIDDLKGLKYRIGGFAGNVLTKLGVVPQQLAGGDIYPALEKGTIDAAEWVGPYDDEKLGFNKVAPYYYYPGWWEGSTNISAYVNIKQWEGLSAEYKAILESACFQTHVWCQARYDAVNPDALRKLIASGTKLRAFSPTILDACLKAANELYAETADKNPKFKKLYQNFAEFRDEELQWFNVTELSNDRYVTANRAKMLLPKNK